MSPKSGYSVFGKDDDDIDDNGDDNDVDVDVDDDGDGDDDGVDGDVDGDDDGDDGELPGCGKDHVFLVSALFSIVSTVPS